MMYLHYTRIGKGDKTTKAALGKSLQLERRPTNTCIDQILSAIEDLINGKSICG